MNVCKACDALIIDIDDAPVHEWMNVLKQCILHPELETVCLAYTPQQQHEKVITVLNSLKVRGGLIVYEKPLDITQVMFDLETRWE